MMATFSPTFVLLLLNILLCGVFAGPGKVPQEVEIQWNFADFTSYSGFTTHIGFNDVISWTWENVCYNQEIVPFLEDNPRQLTIGNGMNIESEIFTVYGDPDRGPRYLFRSGTFEMHANNGTYSVNFTTDETFADNLLVATTFPGQQIACNKNTLVMANLSLQSQRDEDVWPLFDPVAFAVSCDRSKADPLTGRICEITYCPQWAKNESVGICTQGRASTIIIEEPCPEGTYSSSCGDQSQPRGLCLPIAGSCDCDTQYEIVNNETCPQAPNICQNLTICTEGTFEENFNSDCNRTSDRECVPWTFCDDSFCETVAPTTTTDRECRKRVAGPLQCPVDSYHDNFVVGTIACPVCQNVSVCDTTFDPTINSPTEYVLVAPTATSDRQCTDCSTRARFPAVDVVLVLDTSSSYENAALGGNPGTFDLIKTMAIKLIAGWPLPNVHWSDYDDLLNEAGSKFSAITFADDVNVEFDFNAFGYQRDELLSAVNSISHNGGGSYFGKAIDLIYNEMLAGPTNESLLLGSWRNFSVPTVVIVVSDGGLSDEPLVQARLADIARDFKEELNNGDLVIYPIGFGDNFRVDGLNALLADVLQEQTTRQDVLNAALLSIANTTAADLESSGLIDQIRSELSDGVSDVGPKCLDSQFLSSPCTATADRVCEDLTVCVVNDEYVSKHPTLTSDRVCSELTTCHFAAEEFEVSPPSRCYGFLTINKNYRSSSVPDFCSDRVCATLTNCSEVSSPFFHYAASTATLTTDRTCAQQTACGKEEYVDTLATAISDRSCASCATCSDNQFESVACNSGNSTFDGADGVDRLCTNYTICNSSTEFELTNGSTTTDRDCGDVTSCAVGTEYTITQATTTSNTVCGNVSVCDLSFEFEEAPPTSTSDRACINTTAVCSAGEFEVTPPTFTSDRNCTQLDVCNSTTQFQTQGPTLSSNRKCAMLDTCNSNPRVYESVAPTPTSDRSCEQISFCIRGREFEAEPPTLTSDRNCSSISVCLPPTYKASVATDTSDTVCTACTTCGNGNFETGPCANELDRVCTNYTGCEAHEYISTPGNATTDQSCSNVSMCEIDQWVSQAATATSDVVCSLISNCSSTQWQVAASLTAADTLCSNLTTCIADEFESIAPTQTSDRNCSGVTVCDLTYEWESEEPTPTTDRVCSNLTLCTDMEFESLAPNATRDRTCSALTACSDYQTCASESEVCRCDGMSRFVTAAGEYTYAEAKGQFVCHPQAYIDPFVGEPVMFNPPTDKCASRAVPAILIDDICVRSYRCTNNSVSEMFHQRTLFTTSQPGPWGDILNATGAFNACTCASSSCEDCDRTAQGDVCYARGTCPLTNQDSFCDAISESECCNPNPIFRNWTQVNCDALCCGVDCNTVSPVSSTARCECDALGLSFINGNATDTSNNDCVGFTQCNSTSFESASPTPTSDRQCEMCTPCAVDEYASTYCSGTTRYDNICNTTTVCDVDSFASVTATVSSNRECSVGKQCLEGQFIEHPLTLTSDRVCTWLNTSCDCTTQYAESPATVTSEAVCASMTTCGVGVEFETVEGTCSSDRECSSCTHNETTCDGYTLDVILVFDESESINNPIFGGVVGQYGQMLTMAQELVKRLSVRTDGSHVSLVRYGQTARLAIGFDDHTDEAGVLSEIDALRSVSLTRGVTQPHLAIKLIREQLLHTNDPEDPTYAGFRGFLNESGSQVAVIFIGDDQSSTGQLATQVALLQQELALLDPRVMRYVVGSGDPLSIAYQAIVGAGNSDSIITADTIASIDGGSDVAGKVLCPSICPFSQFAETECTVLTDSVCRDVSSCDWVSEIELSPPTLTSDRNCSQRPDVWPTETGYCAGSDLTLVEGGDLDHHDCQQSCETHHRCRSFVRRNVQDTSPCFLNLNHGTCCRSIATVPGWISGISPDCDGCDRLNQSSAINWVATPSRRCPKTIATLTLEPQVSVEALIEECKVWCIENSTCQIFDVDTVSLTTCHMCDADTVPVGVASFIVFERELLPGVCPNNTFETTSPSSTSTHCAVYTPECCDFEVSIAEPTPTSDRQCIPVCPDGEYEEVPANATSDAVCTTLLACNIVYEYETELPTITSDRVCTNTSACDTTLEYQTLAPTPTSDRNCSTLTQCNVSEIQSVAPNSTSNRECEAIIDCVVVNVTYESTPATLTTQPQCENITNCTPTEYLMDVATRTSNNVCKPITQCDVTEFEVNSFTPTSDRECDNATICIVADTMWSFVALTATSDRVCEQRVQPLDHFTTAVDFPLADISQEKILTLYDIAETECALQCMHRVDSCLGIVFSAQFKTCVLLRHMETLLDRPKSLYGFKYSEWKTGNCTNTVGPLSLDPMFSQPITGSLFYSNLDMHTSWTIYRCASLQECHDDCAATDACIVFEYSDTLAQCILWSTLADQPPDSANPYSFVHYNKVKRVTTYPTSAPTLLPTTLPSTLPSTSVPTTSPSTSLPTSQPSHSLPLACPSNCASNTDCKVRRRDNKIVCSACDTNKLLVAGDCLRLVFCLNRKILYGRQQNETCKCLDNNCHYCKRIPGGDTCRKCKNGFYLLDGTCVQSCPPQYASSGVADIGRKCTEPHVCLNGKVLAETTSKCKCTAPPGVQKSNCHTCLFEAGGVGDVCLRCENSKYLNGSVCLDSCVDVPGKIEYTPGVYGNECRDNFTCTNFVDDVGSKCKCSKAVGGKKCLICDWNTAGATCLRCSSGRYLHAGVCEIQCPSNTIPVGTQDEGRFCQ
eukprot:m.247416 g.247416  ORF g.247416 m.247416 type:complete len:2734 (-) comp33855_c1_seq1:19-8220(-)